MTQAMARGHCRGNQYEGEFAASTAQTYGSRCRAVAATCGWNTVMDGSSEKCSTSPGFGFIGASSPGGARYRTGFTRAPEPLAGAHRFW